VSTLRTRLLALLPDPGQHLLLDDRRYHLGDIPAEECHFLDSRRTEYEILLVSILGFKARFIMDSSNSWSKSESARTPRRMTLAPIFSAKSTMSPRQIVTCTLGYSATIVVIISKRSSALNRYFLCGLSAITTSSWSKIAAARFMISKWPFVGGSKEPGKITFIPKLYSQLSIRVNKCERL